MRGPPPSSLALAAVLLAAAALDLWWLDREGLGNLYYAATVKSMLTSWHNFLFASYDPGGFVSVDKPPLGFWIQAASVLLFGFAGVALILPQALAGVGSVGLLYVLVRRAFGVAAGLVAAFALAVAPANVATNRNNTVDSLIVFGSLLAAWAVVRATETGRLRWLLLGAVVVGLGFNVKMLQAYLVVPALGLLYLVAVPVRWMPRIGHLAGAALVLAAVSLSWAVAVDLTPEDQRPYVGGSRENSVLELATGHNGLARIGGLARLFGGPPPPRPGPFAAPGAAARPGPAPGPFPGPPGGESGAPGPLRLFTPQLAGQIAWLIPLALVGALAVAVRGRPRFPLDREGRALVLWGGWFVTQAAFFSATQGIFHRYYLVMLSPAVAALAGAGLATMWRHYRAGGWRAWLLPLALVATAIAQASVLGEYPEWRDRITAPIVAGGALAAIALAFARRREALARVAVSVGTAAMLIAPALWSAITVVEAPGLGLPAGGPRQSASAPPRPGPPPNAPPPLPSAPGPAAEGRLVTFLTENRGDAKFLAATRDQMAASPLIIATGQPVMALGGFGGMDRILDADRFASLVADGVVRYVLVGAAGPPPGPGVRPPSPPPGALGPGPAGVPGSAPAGNDDITRWVRERCALVPSERWRSSRAPVVSLLSADSLYDCGARRSG